MDVEGMSAEKVLAKIAWLRRALENAESELETAKEDLKASPLARRVKLLREQCKLLTFSLDALLGDVQAAYQPPLDWSEALDEAVRIVNDEAPSDAEVDR
ncbi:MAG: hypothetical protein BPHS0_50 [Phage 5P_3]|nr:MAG: hypothetical protein BPHS0_50 [Phage 5P_3]